MKRSLKFFPAALVLVVFISTTASGEPRARLRTASGESRAVAAIQSIRRQTAGINKRISRYRKVKKELSGFSLEGGELVSYLDGPAVVKIVANHYGEMGRSVEEYYYANAKLIFVVRRDYQYDKPLSGKVVRTQENRFYFQNDELIRWINEFGKRVSPSTLESLERENHYLDISRKFVDGVRSKNSTIEG